jgi:superfamily II DNA/RNA helicase
MHGDMTQAQRESVIRRLRSGEVEIVVATDVAARGLDLEHITHVINFDPPADEKDYLHRVGRTARAGRTGTGITFVTPEKRNDVAKIATVLDLRAEFRDAGLRLERSAPQPAGAQQRRRPARRHTARP